MGGWQEAFLILAHVKSMTDEESCLKSVSHRVRLEGGLYRTKQGAVDYCHDFFGKAAFLTVSGQLQAEYYATALSNVYTFAPTFRAEGMCLL